MKHIEDQIQIVCATVLKNHRSLQKDFIFFHPPNGMKTKITIAKRMKQMGLLAGVADLVIIFKNVTAFIELKAQKGRLSDNQKRFMEDCINLKLRHYIIKTDNPFSAKEQITAILKGLREEDKKIEKMYK